MSSTLENLKKELEKAYDALAEAEARCLRKDIENIEETHKQIEQRIQDEKIFSDTLVQSIPDIFFLLDKNGGLLQWNKKLEVLFGLPPEEMMGTKVMAFIHEEERTYVATKLQQAFETGSASVEARMDLTNGLRYYTLTGSRVETKLGVNVIGIGIDITERKQSEKDLKLFRTLLDHSGDAIEVLEPSTLRFLDVNETGCVELGYSRKELLSMSIFDIDTVIDLESDLTKGIREQIQQSESAHFETVHRRKDGSTFPVEVNTALVKLDKEYLISIVRNITERKKSEEVLRRANRSLKTLSSGNMALVRAESEDELLKTITNVIVKEGSYNLAMVCYAKDDQKKSISTMAWSGAEKSYFWEGCPSWADSKQGQLPISRAIRSATTQIRRDIASESNYKPWREAALSRGYISNIALPLIGEGKTFGALSIYSSEVNAFDEEEVRLLEELTGDLSYGIITLRIRAAHEKQETILRQSLEQSIQTIAAIVESRDPYIAGHQLRVSELAMAIALEMGLPEEQINGIHFAAIIHDLGKIHIPAEILSKPGKLSTIEYMLIQTHPQAGYDILKNVKFPWPIADIVLQHHEKLDGSGYPQGLKEGQILLESKIITVADVVEAMSSHRPYRSALEIESALDEIRRGRGSEYDPLVVDTCLKLFMEKGFAFSSKFA